LFSKLYGDPQTGRLDILLNQYLDNTIYPLIEQPGTTLLDIEPFVEDKKFRETILKNVRNERVRGFWRNQFDQLPPATQREQLGSTLRRINAFLVHHRIRDVVGQQKTTIDFQKVIAERKILLLRLQAWLDQDQKRFLGTLIIGELLRAIFFRSDMDRDERSAFALYCDEFQEFATPDFAKLFTQTGKFNIMPTVAHQVRGQFGMLDPNREATLGAPNKLVFSLNPTDARELAPLYADNSTPAEVRLERVYGLSQEPVRDLLQGGQHPNPEIRDFVKRYLRPLEERIEDLRDDIEFERMVRMDFFDQAMLFRIEDAMEAAANPRGLRGGALTSAYHMAEGAHQHTQVMMDMHDAYRQTNGQSGGLISSLPRSWKAR
jgi:hypothetical protein